MKAAALLPVCWVLSVATLHPAHLLLVLHTYHPLFPARPHPIQFMLHCFYWSGNTKKRLQCCSEASTG